MPDTVPKNIQNVTVAAIDIGTNSFHLLIARVNQSGQIEVLDSHKESVRFGESLVHGSEIGRDKIDLGIAALKVMKHIAEPYQPQYRVLATQATRMASNYEEIIDRIAKETGLKVEIIDGLEEARLTYLGMRYCHKLNDPLTLGLDIGGGSTEIVIGRNEKTYFMTSIKLGALTSSKRFFDLMPPDDSKLKRLKNHILTRTAPLSQDAINFTISQGFGTSGTAKALARLHHLEMTNKVLSEPNGYHFPSSDLKIIIDRLNQLRDPKLIKEYYQIDTKRAETILAGAEIFYSVSKLFEVDSWTISTYGIREGIVLDTLQRLDYNIDSLTFNQRWRSVRGFGTKLKIDASFAEATQATAVLVFQKCLNVLPKAELPKELFDSKTLLESAAYLNEAGKFISFNSYHKHSYYLIANSNLLGFSREEKHVIALINRFSRKRVADDQRLKEFPYLRGRIRLVNFLGACIRTARCANRSRLNKVKEIDVGFSRGTLTLTLVHKDTESIAAEKPALRKESKALSKAWNCDVSIEDRIQ